MIGEYPLVQWDFRVFHDGANCHRERLVAFIAPMDARARALAGKLCDAHRIGVPAMAASDTIWPIQPFKVFASFGGISENWICKITHGLVLD